MTGSGSLQERGIGSPGRIRTYGATRRIVAGKPPNRACNSTSSHVFQFSCVRRLPCAERPNLHPFQDSRRASRERVLKGNWCRAESRSHGAGEVNSTTTVKPTADTSYTLIAYGKGLQASAFLLIKVNARVVNPTNRPPVANAGLDQTFYRNTASLDGTRSYDPDDWASRSFFRFTWAIPGATE